jgi:hypothetical protein
MREFGDVDSREYVTISQIQEPRAVSIDGQKSIHALLWPVWRSVRRTKREGKKIDSLDALRAIYRGAISQEWATGKVDCENHPQAKHDHHSWAESWSRCTTANYSGAVGLP